MKKRSIFILKCFKLCKLEKVSITSGIQDGAKTFARVGERKKKRDQNTHVYNVRGVFFSVAFHLFSCICLYLKNLNIPNPKTSLSKKKKIVNS